MPTNTINNVTLGRIGDPLAEYATSANFPASGNESLIYVANNTGQLYKWDGATYYEIGPRGQSTANHGNQHETDGTDPVPLVEYIVPTFSDNVNDLDHLNKDVLYLNADANNRELTGLVAPSFCCIKTLVNLSDTNTIILDNQSINSSPGNRFLSYTGADFNLSPLRSVNVLYDTNNSRWRIL